MMFGTLFVKKPVLHLQGWQHLFRQDQKNNSLLSIDDEQLLQKHFHSLERDAFQVCAM